MNEIERKFIVKSMPDLTGKIPVFYERYYLRIEPNIEERIQKRGDKFEKEIKYKISDLISKKEKLEISKKQFEELKKIAIKYIQREGYKISDEPNVSIKIYHGDFEGLIRAEIEFKSENEAKNFQPLDWMGKEITKSQLGRDSQLVRLNKEEFKNLLKSI